MDRVMAQFTYPPLHRQDGEDLQDRDLLDAEDRPPGPGEPGYEPFPVRCGYRPRPHTKSEARGRGGKDRYVRPEVEHPLDRRQGLGITTKVSGQQPSLATNCPSARPAEGGGPG